MLLLFIDLDVLYCLGLILQKQCRLGPNWYGMPVDYVQDRHNGFRACFLLHNIYIPTSIKSHVILQGLIDQKNEPVMQLTGLQLRNKQEEQFQTDITGCIRDTSRDVWQPLNLCCNFIDPVCAHARNLLCKIPLQ